MMRTPDSSPDIAVEAEDRSRREQLEQSLETVEKALREAAAGRPESVQVCQNDRSSGVVKPTVAGGEANTDASPHDGQSQEDAAGLSALPTFELKAYRLTRRGWGDGWILRPAPPRRHWMDGHPHAYHCLPLVVANQWGWQILCPCDVRIAWDGNPEPTALRVDVEPEHESTIKSQFGQGIVTFSPPWLFRTPPGWDLMIKGPVNRWKPNCVPLEGIIETWWLPYTFTANWKLIQPGEVWFRAGESLCQLLPVPHATFQGAAAIELPLDSDPELAAAMQTWRDERVRRAGRKQQNHLLYRKAEDVDGHLVRVGVPPLTLFKDGEARADSNADSGASSRPSDGTTI